MKVLNIAHNIHTGGAATYVRRVMECQSQIGIKHSVFVGSVSGKFSNEFLLRPNGAHKLKLLRAKGCNQFDKLVAHLEKTPERKHRSFNFIGAITSKSIESFEADIIHLHWINHGLISIGQINRIQKPIIWSVLDMWPFSGGEHYVSDENLIRLNEGYKSENRSLGYFGLDLERAAYNLKNRLRGKPILLLYPSNWLKQVGEVSSLGSNFEYAILPPPINTELFRPLDNHRTEMNATGNCLTIGFGGGLSARKGWSDVKQLYEHLMSKGLRVKLIHFGGSRGDSDLSRYPEYTFVGNIEKDSSKLVSLINEIDVLIFPSILEAFGLLAQEAQSCGTPVIARKATGSESVIEPNHTGWLFSSASELNNIVDYLISMDPCIRLSFRIQARKRAELIWSYEKISVDLNHLYKGWLKN